MVSDISFIIMGRKNSGIRILCVAAMIPKKNYPTLSVPVNNPIISVGIGNLI